jgi:MsuE subfamily FMN reductase
MSIKIVGISGSLSKLSKTELAVQKVLDFAQKQNEDVGTEIIPLSEYDLVFCDGRNPDLYIGDTLRVINKIKEADALIVGSPIYRGTFSGAFKNLFDLIPNDSLKGKVVGIVATGGSDHHFLAIEHQFKPLLGYFNAYVIPGGVYANNSHFKKGELVADDILERLENLATDTVRLTESLQTNYAGPANPDIKRVSLHGS